jgi:hypothetical protein
LHGVCLPDAVLCSDAKPIPQPAGTTHRTFPGVCSHA